MDWARETDQGVVITVRVIPRAARDTVDGPLGDALKIRLSAPPVDGKANKALIRFVASRLAVPASRIVLVGGGRARRKQLLVQGSSLADIQRRLSPEE